MVGSACAGAAAALTAVFTLRGEEVFQLLSLGERLSIAFRVDGLSCIFAVLVSVLWPLACLYAAEYMSREGGENRCLLSGQPGGHFGHRFLRQCADDVLFL